MWQKLYCLSLTESLRDLGGSSLNSPQYYYLYINGASSKPPVLTRVDIIPDEISPVTVFSLPDPESAADSHEILDTSGGTATKEPFYIDYYFDLADTAALPFFGFTDNYLISPQSSCISINYLDFQLFNPGDDITAAGSPVPEPGEHQSVVRLITSLTDSSTESGFIIFRVFSKLTDSLGNSMTEDWGMKLFDED